DPLSADFEVLSSSRNHRISIGQGVNESFTEWVLVLMPKREGRIEIPAIEVGSERSAPIVLTVRPDANPGSSPGRELVLEVDVEREEVHVQQQLLLTVRLMHAVNLAQGATLEEPQIPGAVVRKLGEDSFEKIVGGQRYGVFERRYAVFPQSSGELRVPALRFAGSAGGDSWFDRFGAGSRARRLRSAERVVRVLPPEQGANPWLPARMLTLVETWDRDPESLRVGESATRTLTLSADALTAAQLPPLPDPAIDGLRFYPDQPELNDEAKADGVSGTRVQRVAVVAREAGSFDLPELRLRWWDTLNARFDEAVIPARRMRVLPATGHAVAPGSAPTPEPGTSQPLAPDDAGAGTSPFLDAPEAAKPWPWIAATLLLGLLALVSTTQWLRLARTMPRRPDADATPSREPHAFRALTRACAGSDPALATKQLLEWARLAWPESPPASLAALRERASSERLDAALDALLAHRYGTQKGNWRGEALRGAVEELRRAASRSTGGNDGGLAPLYPGGSTLNE
ncbi:MAG: BatD family protein, partial [Gammaproteobacteria bacterium]